MKLSMKLLLCVVTILLARHVAGSDIIFVNPAHSTKGVAKVEAINEGDTNKTLLKKWVFLNIFNNVSTFVGAAQRLDGSTLASKKGSFATLLGEVNEQFKEQKDKNVNEFVETEKRFNEVNLDFKRTQESFKKYPETKDKTAISQLSSLKSNFNEDFQKWAEYALDGTKKKPDFLADLKIEILKPAYKNLEKSKLNDVVNNLANRLKPKTPFPTTTSKKIETSAEEPIKKITTPATSSEKLFKEAGEAGEEITTEFKEELEKLTVTSEKEPEEGEPEDLTADLKALTEALFALNK